MAKGKHAAALFEVINSGKERNKTGALSTPKWWFKNRPQSQPASNAQADRSASDNSEDDPTARASESIFKPAPVVTPAPTAVKASAFRKLSSTESSARVFDRLGHRLTYRNAAIAAGAILFIGGGAFIVGKKLGTGPQAATATPIETLRARKPNAGVLDANPWTTNSSIRSVAPISRDAGALAGSSPAAGGGNATSPQVTPQSSQEPPTARFDPSAPVRRVVGMQFVMIQSYPKESDALAAAEICTRNGVPCSIQKGFWPQKPDWLAVIGTTGFERTRNNPEYDAYLKLINQISEKFAARSKFRQFEPFLFTWKEPAK
jgi:hypothetical protein